MGKIHSEKGIIIELSIPLISKNHCCNCCKKKKGKICTFHKKPINDVALSCKPKPEWEIE
jgi:hypothetical protein